MRDCVGSALHFLLSSLEPCLQVRFTAKGSNNASPSVGSDHTASKTCTFACGAKSVDPDPADDKRLKIRWAYDPQDPKLARGDGMNCWYCERAWCRIAHKEPDRDREKFKGDMGKDMAKKKMFMDERGKVVQRAKAADSKPKRRRGTASGHKRVAVRTQRYSNCELQRPDDLFWKLNRYKRRFGSPYAPKNKKLGHYISICEGIKGVIVPGDDGEMPFKIRRTQGTRLEKDKEEDCGSDSDDSELADDKFDDLVKQTDARYAELAQGAMNDLLKDFEMTADDTEKEKKRQEVANRKRKSRKKKQTDKDADAKKVQQKKNMFRAADSADSSEEDSDDAPKKKPKAPTSAKSGGANANAPPKSKKGSVSESLVVAGVALGSKKKSEEDDGSGSGDNEDGEPRGKGRPNKDCRNVAESIWVSFLKADETSAFFGPKSDVQRRMLGRWISKIGQKEISAKGDRVSYEIGKKKLQLMDQAIALHRKWQQRSGDMTKIYVEYNEAWQLLVSFAVAEPVVEFRCPFMQHECLQVKVAGYLEAP